MLRNIVDKLLVRDFTARRKRLSEEADESAKRLASLKARKENLERRIRQRPVRGPIAERKRQRKTDAEWKAIEDELTWLEQAQARRHKNLDALGVDEKRRLRRVFMTYLAVEILAMTVGLLPLGNTHAAARHARGVHLDYYAAVAQIMPVLLIAGLVELALFGRSVGGVWAVLTFTLPSVGATVGALVALATHHSTSDTFFLTILGLGLTAGSLVVLFVAHAESREGILD